MATASDIITRCFRENNLKQAGVAPTDAEQAEALGYLNSYIASLYGYVIGELFGDWPVPILATAPINARWPLYPAPQHVPLASMPYPPQNSRVITRLTEAYTIYLPQNPSDGARMAVVNLGSSYDTFPLTINANGRGIDGAASITLDGTFTSPTRWFYRADLGEWRIMAPMTLTDPLPFPEDFDDFFVASLAARLAPVYGKTVHETTGAIARYGQIAIRDRYLQYVPTANFPDSARFNSYQSFAGSWWTQGGSFGNV